jgi:hypothetical protein
MQTVRGTGRVKQMLQDPRQQSPWGSKFYNLNKKKILHSTNFKLLKQIKEN